jgi:hypothetical protein
LEEYRKGIPMMRISSKCYKVEFTFVANPEPRSFNFSV